MMARHRQAKFDNDFICVFNVRSRANSKTNKATKLNIYFGGESKREVRLSSREKTKHSRIIIISMAFNDLNI